MQKAFLLVCIVMMTGCASTSSEQSSEPVTKPIAEIPPPPVKAAEPARKPVPTLTYSQRIHKKIRSNASLQADTPKSLQATFTITQSRSGEVLTVRTISPSGYPPYDAAMISAIRASSPLPKAMDDQEFKPEITLTFRP